MYYQVESSCGLDACTGYITGVVVLVVILVFMVSLIWVDIKTWFGLGRSCNTKQYSDEYTLLRDVTDPSSILYEDAQVGQTVQFVHKESGRKSTWKCKADGHFH